jgi:ferrous iron transport protein B
MRELTVALAGNPNVGKSTVFNSLTGLHQHTGNWPGKTVATASGTYVHGKYAVHLVDLPGTYSLAAASPEEVIARDYIRSGAADVVLVVADATSLHRNLNLVLQVRRLAPRMVLCVNLLDEAARKGIRVDLARLEEQLGVPVAGTAARSGEGLEALCRAVERAAEAPPQAAWRTDWGIPAEWALLHLLPACGGDRSLAAEVLTGERPCEDERQETARNRAWTALRSRGWDESRLRDHMTACLARQAGEIAAACVRQETANRAAGRDRRWDRWLTSRRTGIPAMLLLLALVFYLTIWGANYPSQLLSVLLLSWQEPLRRLLSFAPLWVQGALVDGMYRTVAWVVGVMLPPMAIFFPLFTLLEDMGYLPRVAFNLDRFFRTAGAHGRQSLTMCMALGCNACAVTGCRIIDGERQRLIAILTNSLMPCNGRLPTLIVLITMFFLGGSRGLGRSLLATGLFLGAIVFAVGMTWLASRLLSRTVLRGEEVPFALELPPYRMPRVGQVLVRSVLDRTLFVLGRAVTVAAPAGLVIWVLGNVEAGGAPLLTAAAAWLDPLGRWMGLDGMILLAFLLGFPANEIVLPALLMGYLQTGSLTAFTGAAQLQEILLAHGWTGCTALCAMVLCLLHFPCGTTCLTIWRETGSVKWTAVGILLPTALGVMCCMLLRLAAGLVM